MIDQATRTAPLRIFAAIVANAGEDRQQAGLRALQALRAAGASWRDVLPAMAAWDGHSGWRTPFVASATRAQQVAVLMAPRLDAVPPADLAELAVLCFDPRTAAGDARATAIGEAQNLILEAEHQAEISALMRRVPGQPGAAA